MKLQEKLNYLFENHYEEWMKTRDEVTNELSYNNSLYCFCGRLATGLHEMHCIKFKNKVNSETIKRLEHLIKKE